MMGSKLVIRKILEVFPHWETDHSVKDANSITCTVVFLGSIPGDEVESRIEFGLRVEDRSVNAQLVREYLQKWLDAGGVIPRWVPPTDEEIRELMSPLTARQLRLALVQNGWSLNMIDKAILEIKDDIEKARAQVEWQFANIFKRTDDFPVGLFLSLGITPEEADILWIDASNL